MQEPLVKLKEIIWEITDTCWNNCEYCGSKDTLNIINPSMATICDIARDIAEYPPEAIDISGGDPLRVDLDTHMYVTDILKAKKVKVKILVNPISLTEDSNSKLVLYDWIGVSVNTDGELDLLKSKWKDRIPGYVKARCTIISNFNLTNFFTYSKIEEFVRANSLSWQIQYTMYDKPHRDALYSNPEALELFFAKVTNSKNIGTKIIVADNMNSGKCSAGMYSCGILADGSVATCLSVRSWGSKDDRFIVGNLKDNSLKDIWVKGFSDFRCSEFKCCKDICKAPYVPAPTITTFPDQRITIKPRPWQEPIVMMYAVQEQPYNPNMTFVYGVTTDWTREYDNLEPAYKNIATVAMAYAVASYTDTNTAASVFNKPQPSGYKDWSNNVSTTDKVSD